jgi:hypothetical protein
MKYLLIAILFLPVMVKGQTKKCKHDFEIVAIVPCCDQPSKLACKKCGATAKTHGFTGALDSSSVNEHPPKITIGSTPSISGSVITLPEPKEYFIGAFLKYYDQYKVECHNDSTSIYGYFDMHGGTNEGYIHRQENISDFVEFLRKKK